MWTEIKKGESVLVERCKVAKTFGSRFLGLMGRKSIPEDEAIVFPRCSSIHTFFMRIPIDVVFVSKEGQVVRVLSKLKPWKMLAPVRGASHVIEMGASLAVKNNIRIGDNLNCPGVFG